MQEINYLPIFGAAIATFLASMVWYMSFGMKLAKLNPKAYGDMKKPQPVKMLFELIRNLVLAFFIAYFIRHLGIAAWPDAFHLGLAFWIGFPVIIILGAVVYEKVPFQLAAIHAGDWLIKLLLLTTMLTLWH